MIWLTTTHRLCDVVSHTTQQNHCDEVLYTTYHYHVFIHLKKSLQDNLFWDSAGEFWQSISLVLPYPLSMFIDLVSWIAIKHQDKVLFEI